MATFRFAQKVGGTGIGGAEAACVGGLTRHQKVKPVRAQPLKWSLGDLTVSEDPVPHDFPEDRRHAVPRELEALTLEATTGG